MRPLRLLSNLLGGAVILLAALLTPIALQAQSYRVNVRTGLPVNASFQSALTAPDCASVPGNPFSNCSFETEDFTDWVTQDLPVPFFPLTVDGAGVTPGFGFFTSDPTNGDFAALHGFDGSGEDNEPTFASAGGTIRVCQDVMLPGNALLEFDYRAAWDLLNEAEAILDRTFEITVEPSGGGPAMLSTEVLRAAAGTVNLDTGDLQGAVDLSAVAAGPARICFDWIVPEDFSGPAFFQLDNISIESAADLEVTKAAADNGDGTGSYHVTLTNNGPLDATDVVVQDDLPAALTVLGWTTTQGAFDPSTGRWEVGMLTVGASAQLWIDVRFDAQGIYENCAEVAEVNEPDQDSEPGDGEGDDHDCAAVFRGVPQPAPDFVSGPGPGGVLERLGNRFLSDLQLTKTASVGEAAVGDQVTWTITINNAGPQNNAGIEVQEFVPDCLVVDAVTPSAGTTFDAEDASWQVGKLRVGQQATLTVVTTIGADCSGAVTNRVEVTEAHLPDPDDLFSLFGDPPVEDEEAEATVTVSAAAAKAVRLLAAYPNPFNPATVIPFEVREAAQVRVAVYDLLGRQVQVLVDGAVSAGVHEAAFRAESLPTGLYLVRLEAAGVVQTRRITLMK